MTRRIAVILVAFAILLLAGCQSLPSVPVHKYYRLQALAAAGHDTKATVLLSGALAVRPLRAEGLYGERAIVFSDAQQRSLQQYHYHHWFYSPEQLVQEHLAERLRQSGIATEVKLAERGNDGQYLVSGRILRFDMVLASQPMAAATLELRLEKANRVLWRQTYAAKVATVDGSMTGFAATMDIALARIYGEFLGDLRRLKPE